MPNIPFVYRTISGGTGATTIANIITASTSTIIIPTVSFPVKKKIRFFTNQGQLPYNQETRNKAFQACVYEKGESVEVFYYLFQLDKTRWVEYSVLHYDNMSYMVVLNNIISDWSDYRIDMEHLKHAFCYHRSSSLSRSFYAYGKI